MKICRKIEERRSIRYVRTVSSVLELYSDYNFFLYLWDNLIYTSKYCLRGAIEAVRSKGM